MSYHGNSIGDSSHIGGQLSIGLIELAPQYGRRHPEKVNNANPPLTIATDFGFIFQDIITHRLKFSEVVKGIEMVNNSTQSIKVILLPDL